ncbi:MAG: hypothetical protein ABSF49_07795 [Roseiarcus sp.]|uniref:hypothetical protein n=1 Tax=Roseiarcus sp. TaxID=1969460 RepID=UPI003C1E35AB
MIAVTRNSFESRDATQKDVNREPMNRQDNRTRAGFEAKRVTHRIRSIERAAALLIAEHGPAGAQGLVRRELSAARRARSRIRHEFWASVGRQIAGAWSMGLSN